MIMATNQLLLWSALVALQIPQQQRHLQHTGPQEKLQLTDRMPSRNSPGNVLLLIALQLWLLWGAPVLLRPILSSVDISVGDLTSPVRLWGICGVLETKHSPVSSSLSPFCPTDSGQPLNYPSACCCCPSSCHCSAANKADAQSGI